MKRPIFSIQIFALFFLYLGCSDKPGYNCRCKSITDYDVNPTVTTPDGIEVDDSGFTVDLDLLDKETDSLEKCLGLSINRAYFTVKIAPDWYTSSCSGKQGFPCNISSNACSNTTPQCPCACAGAVQPPNILVLPPDLKAYRHELIHLVTHTDHGNPQFDKCEN